ncbi:MAG: hypothetical protein JWO32_2249 [Bacteroidetes bacterium]|nr:hypothetical protein [Bacteroidota bacterium]
MWDNGILYILLEDNVTIELKDSERQLEFLKSKFDGTNKMRVLVESGRYTEISKEAREFSSQPGVNSMTLATAVIVKSLAHRIIINFIINFTRQQAMKMRMFDNKEKAIDWLLNLKQETISS